MRRKYDINKDIQRLSDEIAQVVGLRELTERHAWKEIVGIFNGVIGRFFQEVYDKCENPGKYEIEIRSKKMVADALGEILATIDKRVSSESFLRGQLGEKEAHRDNAMHQQI